MTDTSQVKIIPASEAPAKKADARGRPQKWRFEEMKVGEAVEIPADKLQSCRQKCSSLNRQERDKEALAGRAEDGPRRWSAGEGVDGKFYVWRHQ